MQPFEGLPGFVVWAAFFSLKQQKAAWRINGLSKAAFAGPGWSDCCNSLGQGLWLGVVFRLVANQNTLFDFGWR